MISTQEAESIILQQLFKPEITEVEINDAIGRVLAEEILADRDFPPFNRVAMDGIAIQHQSFKTGHREFKIEGVQAAGQPQATLQSTADCIEVMTGAMLPANSDTVIRYEDIEIKDKIARVLTDAVTCSQNIHGQGQDAKRGDSLLGAGFRISPAEIALLASVGKSKVKVYQPPKTAIISTGDELVDIPDTPQPWQIRRSNGYAVQAALKAMNIESKLHHFPDNQETLERGLRKILDVNDLIILSGGVSKGKFDFIPKVLEQLGIKKRFHQVSQKPGKPFWFGRSDRQTVFALPGNPVSTYMCFYRYIKPWIEKSFGLDTGIATATLAKDFQFKPDLTYFLQVKVVNDAGKLIAHPDPGGGSGDFANLKNVDGFLELPAGHSDFKAGETFSYFSFR